MCCQSKLQVKVGHEEEEVAVKNKDVVTSFMSKNAERDLE